MCCSYLPKAITSTLTHEKYSLPPTMIKPQLYSEKKSRQYPLGNLVICSLFAFIIIWVVIPVSFMLSVHFQTFMVFGPVDLPMNANFDKPEEYGVKGVHNFYINTRDINNFNTSARIGVWLILPEGEINTSRTNVADIIRNSDYDILIYLHGICSNRAKAIEQYRVLRKQFLIIAVDHRGYGDSGLNVPLNEMGIAFDHVQIYDWIKSVNPNNDVYYWGHSLGTGIGTKTLKLLKEHGHEMPKGIVLESPFTSVEDMIVNLVFGWIFSWLHYFEATILEPLNQNGFHFRSSDNIQSIDCPIMILHAEDDMIVPYTLGKRLARIAEEKRKSDQGSVTFHGFSSEQGLGHNNIIHYPKIGSLIDDFKSICRNFSDTVRPRAIYLKSF